MDGKSRLRARCCQPPKPVHQALPRHTAWGAACRGVCWSGRAGLGWLDLGALILWLSTEGSGAEGRAQRLERVNWTWRARFPALSTAGSDYSTRSVLSPRAGQAGPPRLFQQLTGNVMPVARGPPSLGTDQPSPSVACGSTPPQLAMRAAQHHTLWWWWWGP